MKTLKLVIPILGILMLTACSNETTASNSDDSIQGVAAAAQISVVTAK